MVINKVKLTLQVRLTFVIINQVKKTFNVTTNFWSRELGPIYIKGHGVIWGNKLGPIDL